MFDSLASSRSLGEILALASGLVWAVAVVLFRVSGRRIHPIGLNLAKNVLALAFIVPTLLVLGEPLFPAVPAATVGLLLLSGVLGIAVSDTLFFHALNRLGASLTAIVDCFYSPFVIALSFVLLGERLTPIQLLGAGARRLRRPDPLEGRQDREARPRKDLVLGILYGILAMFFVALGIVMVKPILGGVSVFWATFVRVGRRRRRSRRPRPVPQEQAGHPRPPARAPATGRPWSRRPSSAPTSRSSSGWAA